jgi:hypothetical protein
VAGKTSTFSYYFRPAKPGVWEISKFEGSEGGDTSAPTIVYTIKGDPFTSGKWACDCPATWGGKNRKSLECKHGALLRRWINIDKSKSGKGKVVYYNNTTDKFHVLDGLDLA